MTLVSSILTYFASLMIAPQAPTGLGSGWILATEGWVADGHGLYFEASSLSILDDCRKHPEHRIKFPIVMQGLHEIFVDGALILKTGDPSHRNASYSFNGVSLACRDERLVSGQKLVWKTYTATKSLAVIRELPVVEAEFWSRDFFNRTLPAATGVALPILGMIFSCMFWGKIAHRSVLSLLAACLGLGVFFTLLVPEYFEIIGTPLFIHSCGDAFLWAACIFVGVFFRLMGVLPKSVQMLQAVLSVLGITTIILSTDLDQEQLGSTISFIGNLIMCLTISGRSLYHLIKNFKFDYDLLQVAASVMFCVTGINDMLVVFGSTGALILFPIGTFAMVAFMALSVNAKISEIYRERDYLRQNLQREVDRKTAELIQSAKLASLGTLAAGIAHEINNSLNYVNGSLKPLSLILAKTAVTEEDRAKAGKLIKLMSEGLSLTFSIIVNLKRHTSSAASELEDLILRDAVEGALVLLRGRIDKQIILENNLSADLITRATRVSLSQVFVNLIGNAAEAMDSAVESATKKITIEGGTNTAGVWISVSDTGPGIPVHIQQQIFDPFFTTKAVGKGTGLGLHIVRSELERTGASISVHSQPGKGATFTIQFGRAPSVKGAAA